MIAKRSGDRQHSAEELRPAQSLTLTANAVPVRGGAAKGLPISPRRDTGEQRIYFWDTPPESNHARGFTCAAHISFPYSAPRLAGDFSLSVTCSASTWMITELHLYRPNSSERRFFTPG